MTAKENFAVEVVAVSYCKVFFYHVEAEVEDRKMLTLKLSWSPHFYYCFQSWSW
jgi:hypothetical protein